MKKLLIVISLCSLGLTVLAQNTLPNVGQTNALNGICWQERVTNTTSPFLVDGVPVVHVGHNHSNYWQIVTIAKVYWMSFDYVAGGVTNTRSIMAHSNVVSNTKQWFSVPMVPAVNAVEELPVP